MIDKITETLATESKKDMESDMPARVGIIMGSDSDWPKIKGIAEALDEFRRMQTDSVPDYPVDDD